MPAEKAPVESEVADVYTQYLVDGCFREGVRAGVRNVLLRPQGHACRDMCLHHFLILSVLGLYGRAGRRDMQRH